VPLFVTDWTRSPSDCRSRGSRPEVGQLQGLDRAVLAVDGEIVVHEVLHDPVLVVELFLPAWRFRVGKPSGRYAKRAYDWSRTSVGREVSLTFTVASFRW